MITIMVTKIDTFFDQYKKLLNDSELHNSYEAVKEEYTNVLKISRRRLK